MRGVCDSFGFVAGILAVTILACAPEGPPEAPMIEIPNAIRVEGGILSGGQPDEAALRRAAEAGYRTIVNLRGPGEEGSLDNEAELVDQLGMRYVALPIDGPEAFNEANARALADLISDPSALPAMVHCRSGNRTGLLLGLKAFYVDGIDGPAALELGRAGGARRIPDSVHAILGTTSD